MVWSTGRGVVAIIVCCASLGLEVLPRAASAQSGPVQAPSVSASTPASSPAPSSPSPAASSSPGPSPAPSARIGALRLSVDAHTTFISQAAGGPGTRPPEAAGFATGSPLSPLTPYDTFSSAPLTSGNGGEAALYLRPAYATRAFDIGATIGIGYLRGSVTNAVYWGENVYPALNPHLGSQHVPYRVALPAHAGQDDGSGVNAGILAGSIVARDGTVALRGGWIDLAQTDAFVFAQPAITSSAPSLGFATAESLGDGSPAIDWWTPPASVLPLHGVDLVAKRGPASLELTDAALPSLPGTGARLHMGSLVFDRGEGTRFSAQLLHVSTGGDPIATSVLYGSQGQLIATPQGELPISVVGGQRQTIFGARAAFHATKRDDAIVEYGRSTYDVEDASRPGPAKPGNYYHAGLSRTIGRATISLDGYRNEPFYAQIILPYGAPENVWSVAWSWPGQWLKSNYQLINNFPVNINRQGYRAKIALGGSGPLHVRASYANFGQIEAITTTRAATPGFVDGFFLPQRDDAPTLGRQRQYGFFAGWHPGFVDVTFDYAEDTMRRPALTTQPGDHVSYDAPEAVMTVSKKLSKTASASIAYGRYAMRGSFAAASTNVDYQQRVVQSGVQFQQSPAAALLATVRFSAFGGMPSQPGGPSPDFRSTMFVVEQRLKL